MSEIPSQKIGIMGGTFDPIHNGHIAIAECAVKDFSLDKVLFMPTGKSPHKSVTQVTTPDIRCKMVKLAIEENPFFEISMLEVENEEVNYTYLTLQKLHKLYANTKFYFIMGEDSLDDFSKWKQPAEICKQASVLVAVRNENGNGISDKIAQVKKLYQGDFYILTTPNIPVSSRDIRNRILKGERITGMLPPKVEHYIRMHEMYIK